MNIVSLRCPNCDGLLKLDSTKEYGICSFCGNKVIVQQSIMIKQERLSMEEREQFRTREEKAEAYIKLRKFMEAEGIYKSLIEDFPGAPKAYLGAMKAATSNYRLIVSDDVSDRVTNYYNSLQMIMTDEQRGEYEEDIKNVELLLYPNGKENTYYDACKRCGAIIKYPVDFCPQCGKNPYGKTQEEFEEEQREYEERMNRSQKVNERIQANISKNGTFCMFSLICGIAGMVLGCIIIGLPLAIAGVVLGILGLRKNENMPKCIVGIATGAVGIILGLCMIALVDWDDTGKNETPDTEQSTTISSEVQE